MCTRLPTHRRRKIEMLPQKENPLIRMIKRREHKNRTRRRRQYRRSSLCDRILGVLNSLLIDKFKRNLTFHNPNVNERSSLSGVSLSSLRPKFGYLAWKMQCLLFLQAINQFWCRNNTEKDLLARRVSPRIECTS